MSDYYSTLEWKKIKDSVLKRDGYKCQRCGATEKLAVHHKTPRRDGGADHESNLKTVCKSCHVKEHYDLQGQRGMGKYQPTDEELRDMGLGWVFGDL